VVVGAEIRSNPHPLGRILMRSGRVTEQDLLRARAFQAAGDQRRLGEILVAQGLVHQRDLHRYVRQQIEEVVSSWSDGPRGTSPSRRASTAIGRPRRRAGFRPA
jgi:hypothetical protein